MLLIIGFHSIDPAIFNSCPNTNVLKNNPNVIIQKINLVTRIFLGLPNNLKFILINGNKYRVIVIIVVIK